MLAAAATHTMFFGVPTMYHRLAATGQAGELAALRLCVSGSAPLSADLWHELAGQGVEVLERYGMTETLLTLSNPLHGERRPGSVGVPLPGVEAAIGDPDGDGVGELSVRGPALCRGYWRRPDDETPKGGWFATRRPHLGPPRGRVRHHPGTEHGHGHHRGTPQRVSPPRWRPSWPVTRVCRGGRRAPWPSGARPSRRSSLAADLSSARKGGEGVDAFKRPGIVHIVEALPSRWARWCGVTPARATVAVRRAWGSVNPMATFLTCCRPFGPDGAATTENPDRLKAVNAGSRRWACASWRNGRCSAPTTSAPSSMRRTSRPYCPRPAADLSSRSITAALPLPFARSGLPASTSPTFSRRRTASGHPGRLLPQVGVDPMTIANRPEAVATADITVKVGRGGLGPSRQLGPQQLATAPVLVRIDPR